VGAKGKYMKHVTLFAVAVLGLAGCSSGDPMAGDVFVAIQKTDFIKQATPVSCDYDNTIKPVLFQDKCWTRDIKEADIEAIGQEAKALGLTVQQALNLQTDIIETDQFGSVLMRAETQDDCAHYVQAHITPIEDLVEPHAINFRLSVTKKPHCGAFDLDAAI
jgi:hypothetical protein